MGDPRPQGTRRPAEINHDLLGVVARYSSAVDDTEEEIVSLHDIRKLVDVDGKFSNPLVSAMGDTPNQRPCSVRQWREGSMRGSSIQDQ